jgi:hypothetical protein
MSRPRGNRVGSNTSVDATPPSVPCNLRITWHDGDGMAVSDTRMCLLPPARHLLFRPEEYEQRHRDQPSWDPLGVILIDGDRR